MRLNLSRAGFLASLVFIAGGCSSAPNGLNNGAPDDLPAACSGASCVCSSDGQCGGATPRCDKNAGKCVPCLPLNDNCPKGQRCVDQKGVFACVDTCAADVDCSPSDAGTSQSCCGGACIDSQNDPNNCGACGRVCPGVQNALPGCAGAVCGLGVCNQGFADCDHNASNGCEINTSTDLKNCGACGKSCSAGAHEAAACTGGSCQFTCDAGFGDCNNNPSDGCETVTSVDVKNCGGCGMPCAPVTNGTPACKMGACAVGSCNAGFADCDGQLGNGCEVNLDTDIAHCGDCGVSCANVANGAGGCMNGACVIASCNMGFSDCDGVFGNGCEVNLVADAKNCGACGHSCVGVNSVQACQASKCVVTGCSQGFSDCNKDPKDGCEVAISIDVNNCSMCGNVCPMIANGVANCLNSVCGIAGCNFGWADCNKDASDGCEADLKSVMYCGACGNVCMAPANASPGCLGGKCGIGKCNMLWGDCNMNAMDGCETNLSNDVANCGKCGAGCAPANAKPQCLGGQCGILSCNPGFGDCNMKVADGCELDVTSDPKNCGSCGNVCPQNTPYCANSVCVASAHNVATLTPDANTVGQNGCGDYSTWYTQNMGQMTYDDCEAAANKYGAQYMGMTGWFGNYAPGYQSTARWVGEADANNGFVGTANWSQVGTQAKNQQSLCVLAYANNNGRGNGTFNTSWVSANGKTYKVSDYGVISEKTCYSNANAAGARPLNPWMFNDATKSTAHMVENHLCHGSCEYTGLNSYSADGGVGNHTYRCLVGYTD
jgi:hypothetical protein